MVLNNFIHNQMGCESRLPYKFQSSHSGILKDLLFLILPHEHFQSKTKQTALPPS